MHKNIAVFCTLYIVYLLLRERQEHIKGEALHYTKRGMPLFKSSTFQMRLDIDIYFYDPELPFCRVSFGGCCCDSVALNYNRESHVKVKFRKKNKKPLHSLQ